MATTVGTWLNVFSYRPQRRLLVELLHRNPQDDTPVGGDDPQPDGEGLEILFDFRHFHLAELEAEGFVDYDRENNVVTKGPDFGAIKPLLDLIDEHSDELPSDWL